MIKGFSTMLAATTISGLALAGSLGEAKAGQTLRYATWDPPTHEVRTLGINRWIKEVSKATNGRVKIKMLTKGLGAPPAYHDFIKDGAIDVAHIIPAYTPGRFLLHKVAEFPFLTDSAKARTVAYWRVYKKHFEKANEAKGMKLMTVWVHGPGLIHNAKRPVTEMSALKGLKLRVSGDNIAALGKAMGATPIFAPITKVHNMLSKGVIDGMFLTYEGVKNFKLGKLVKYTTVPPGGLYATMFQMYMNKAKWDGLPKQDRQILDKISGEHAANYIGEAWDTADQNGIKHMKEMGIKIIPMPDAFAKKARALWQPIQAEWMKKAAAKGVDGAAALAMLKAEIKNVEAGK